METKFSKHGPTSVPDWRQKDIFSVPKIDNNEVGNKLDEIRTKRKKISYEKDYFMQMLKNIENGSSTTTSFTRSNYKNLGQRLHSDTNQNYCNDNENVPIKDRKHYNRQSLVLQTSDEMLGIVDRIIEKNKDTKKSSPISITKRTEDAGEMINYLLNKTYPNSYQGGKELQKSISPVRSESLAKGSRQRDSLSHRLSWNNIPNNNNKERLSR